MIITIIKYFQEREREREKTWCFCCCFICNKIFSRESEKTLDVFVVAFCCCLEQKQVVQQKERGIPPTPSPLFPSLMHCDVTD